MKRDTLQPIVIKRIKKPRGREGNVQWKIAYADFVTAMMAFFLLMWLLGSTSKGYREGIQEYFRTPLTVALSGGTKHGDATSIVLGGGEDLTRIEGEAKQTKSSSTEFFNLEVARAQVARDEAARLRQLKSRVEQIFESKDRFAPYRNQVKLDITSEGLRIQIVDDQNRPMFDVGKSELHPWMKDILRELAVLLNEVDNKISLAGHTDAKPYFRGERGYSNWELSSDRANASRRELVAAGMAEDKIIRVVGLASSVPLNADDPYDPINRRISIVVLNKKATENMISNEGIAVRAPDNAHAVEMNGEAATPLEDAAGEGR